MFMTLRSLSLALFLPGVLAACTSLTERRSATVRFKVEVTLRQNGLQKTGKAVWSYTLRRPAIQLVSSYDVDLYAEAIPIPLQNGLVAFVLPIGRVYSAPPNQWLEDAFLPLEERQDAIRIASLHNLSLRVGERKTIACFNNPQDSDRIRSKRFIFYCPQILTTKDLNNPRTLQIADFEQESGGGAGISVTKLKITITDEPPTNVLERWLPWLKSAQNRPLARDAQNNINWKLDSAIHHLRFPFERDS